MQFRSAPTAGQGQQAAPQSSGTFRSAPGAVRYQAPAQPTPAPAPQPTFFQNVLNTLGRVSNATGNAVSKVPLVGNYLAYLGSGYGQAAKTAANATKNFVEEAKKNPGSVADFLRTAGLSAVNNVFQPGVAGGDLAPGASPFDKNAPTVPVSSTGPAHDAFLNQVATNGKDNLATKAGQFAGGMAAMNPITAGIMGANKLGANVLETPNLTTSQKIGRTAGILTETGLNAFLGSKLGESFLKPGEGNILKNMLVSGAKNLPIGYGMDVAANLQDDKTGKAALKPGLNTILAPLLSMGAEGAGAATNKLVKTFMDRGLSKGTAEKISGDLVKEAETVPSQAQEQVKSTSQQIAESKSQSEISDILKSVGIDRPSVAKDLINEKRPSVIANRIKQEITRKESSGSKIIESFSKSKDQKVIGQVNGRDIELGTFGKEQTASKTSKFQPDRFPESELKTTLDHVIKETKADNGSKGYREANTALIAKMPDGETRVIYTRPNAAGKDEIINWHSVDETKNPNYVKTLESFGAPSRIRTGAIPLEEGRSSPLAYGGTESISEPKKEIQPQTEKVTVPRSQVPVGGSGETKVSRLAARVSDKLGAITPEERAKLPEYEAMTHKDQLQKAAAFVESNPKDALAVLRGDKPAPEGLLHGSIFLAAEQKAIDSGDATLIRDLASLRATRAGQELSILAARDPNSPVKYLDEVKQARYEIKGGEEKVKKQVKQTVKEGMDVIKKAAPKKAEWSAFLDEIRCK